DVAGIHVLADRGRELRLVPIEGGHPTAVVDDDRIAVAALHAGDDDGPGPTGMDGRAVAGLQVVTGVEALRAAHRVHARSEAADDRPRHRAGVAVPDRARLVAPGAQERADGVRHGLERVELGFELALAGLDRLQRLLLGGVRLRGLGLCRLE